MDIIFLQRLVKSVEERDLTAAYPSSPAISSLKKDKKMNPKALKLQRDFRPQQQALSTLVKWNGTLNDCSKVRSNMHGPELCLAGERGHTQKQGTIFSKKFS
jgi:hypothetical protein